ncbi:MAG TPA: SH3 domain-containing protein [Thermoanaerobaculia bacterium]|nr:SH3 domain-containing protein [Thermoanaerobaculia bacterium]
MPSVRVTASVLNLRGGPGREFPVVARLPRGTILERLAASPDGRWLHLRRGAFDGELTAWASARYLSAVNGSPPPGPTDGPPWPRGQPAHRRVPPHDQPARN